MKHGSVCRKNVINIAKIKLRAKNSSDMIAGPGSVMPLPDGKETVFSSHKPHIFRVLGTGH